VALPCRRACSRASCSATSGELHRADRAKPGLFEVAHGGTIFLDEIGEVAQATQVKLLRVLDTSTFRRVGAPSRSGGRARPGRHQPDLPAMVRQGCSAKDLFYRLRTVMVELPPLRESRATWTCWPAGSRP